jgi:hypothetical protein
MDFERDARSVKQGKRGRGGKGFAMDAGVAPQCHRCCCCCSRNENGQERQEEGEGGGPPPPGRETGRERTRRWAGGKGESTRKAAAGRQRRCS